MCARFYIPQTEVSEDLELLLLEAENRGILRRPPVHVQRGEIHPGDMVGTIAKSRKTGSSAAFPMKWGFRTSAGLVFNARIESVDSKPLFQEAFASRRCLIPMTAYFEWDHRQKPMVKYRIAPAHQAPVHYLAGIYRFEKTEPVFTVLTRPASADLAAFHDRMPVILSGENRDVWLAERAPRTGDILAVSEELFRYGVEI